MPEPGWDRLDSWKEIAEHLGRDVRTVRRWEKDRSLPVHRVPGGGRAGVYAFRSEIDAWLKGQQGNTSPNGDGAAESPSLPSISSGAASVADSGAIATQTRDDQSGEAVLRVQPAKPWWLAGVLLVACGLAVFSYRVWLSYYGGPPARVGFSGNDLIAWNDRGNILWKFPFDRPLSLTRDEPGELGAVIADLGPGRRRDVLAEAPFSSSSGANSSSDELYCLSARREFRWRYSFDDKPQLGGHRYDSPWVLGVLMVLGSDSARSVWCSARQYYYSASMVVELDRDGHELARFVNWGHVASLNHVLGVGGSYILVGGISNQCNCGFLAVLQEVHASGSSPALSPAFQCENCPPGRPYVYLLFPRSELTVLSGSAYNNVKLIRVDGGHVAAGVSETASPEVPGPDWEEYDLSDDFVPQSVSISDHFWTQHHEMEVEGKIHHTVEQCPERTGPQTVSMWTPQAGWRKIKVPVVPVPR